MGRIEKLKVAARNLFLLFLLLACIASCAIPLALADLDPLIQQFVEAFEGIF